MFYFHPASIGRYLWKRLATLFPLLIIAAPSGAQLIDIYGDQPFIETAVGSYGLAVGDHCGDPAPDLILACSEAKRLQLFRNAEGVFVLHAETPLAYEPYFLALGDIDCDGVDELAVNDLYGRMVFLYDIGADGFTEIARYPADLGPWELTFADLDDDECLDLIIPLPWNDSLALIFGDEQIEQMEQVEIPLLPGAISCAPLDYDGDGDRDLAILCQDQFVRLMENLGLRNFVGNSQIALDSVPKDITAFDYDLDDQIDILVCFDTPGTYVDHTSFFRGQGDGNFVQEVNMPSGNTTIAAADLTADEHLDIVTTDYGTPGGGGGKLDIYVWDDFLDRYAHEDGLFLGATTRNMVTLDFEGDGDLDFAVAVVDSAKVFLVENFSTPTVVDDQAEIENGHEVMVHPNPGNPDFVITYRLGAEDHLTLSIHDLAGRRRRLLVDTPAPAGSGQVRWNGRDASGQDLASGVYLIRLSTPRALSTSKLLLIR